MTERRTAGTVAWTHAHVLIALTVAASETLIRYVVAPSAFTGFGSEICRSTSVRQSTGRPRRWARLPKTRLSLRSLFAGLLSAGLLLAQPPSLENAPQPLSKGSLIEAVGTLRQVIASDSSNADAHSLLGTTLALEGMRSEAIAQLLDAVRLRPDSASAYNMLGMVLSRFAEMKAARQAFEKSSVLHPNFAEADVNLSLMLAQAGELNTAGDHLDRAIELQGGGRTAEASHYLRAKVWAAQNKTENAIGELEKVVELRPDYAEAWSDLGGMRRLALDRDGARQALETAVALNPDDALAQCRSGLLYRNEGEDQKYNADAAKALYIARDQAGEVNCSVPR